MANTITATAFLFDKTVVYIHMWLIKQKKRIEKVKYFLVERSLIMKVFIVNCNFNTSRALLDCAFKKKADAEAYADAMNGDKAKAIARCKELITQRDSEAMVKFLVEERSITFDILAAELK